MNTNIISDINVAMYYQADLYRQAQHDALARQANHTNSIRSQFGRALINVGRRMQSR